MSTLTLLEKLSKAAFIQINGEMFRVIAWDDEMLYFASEDEMGSEDQLSLEELQNFKEEELSFFHIAPL